MIKGDLFTGPIEYAIKNTMKQYEKSEGDDEKLIYELLKRSAVIWENIKIHNLQICGMTFEQFCNQCEEKTNVVFLTDEEIHDINKAMQIIKIIKE